MNQVAGRGRGRGGRMVAGRGRGRGGRMMMAGRGNRPGRVPHYMWYLNEYNGYRMLSYLTVEERKTLGTVYPRFRIPERKKQAQGKNAAAGAKKEDNEEEDCTATPKNPDAILAEDEAQVKPLSPPSDRLPPQPLAEDNEATDDEEGGSGSENEGNADESKPKSKKKPRKRRGKRQKKKNKNTRKPNENNVEPEVEPEAVAEAPAVSSAPSTEPKPDNEAETSKEEAEETKGTEETKDKEEGKPDADAKGPQKKKHKDDISVANPSASDPHTLLARLNTRRLYQRIRYYKKHDKDFDIRKAYVQNKNTQEIANYEWKDLMEAYRVNQIAKIKQQKEDEEAKKKEEERAETGKKLEAEGIMEDVPDLEIEEDKKEEEEEEKTPEEVEQAEQEKKKKDEFALRARMPSSCELLMFSPIKRAVAVLASYPRSGNSLLRNLYERTTLRVTGSDMRGGLTKHDLVGEAATGQHCVQFVKTHFPERRGTPPFAVSRAVLLVRNPYDAMESYFNLMTTNTHTTSLTDEQRRRSRREFSEMAKKEILVWRDFHEYWLRQNIPLLVIRYEDLIRYTDKVTRLVLQFVLEINDMRFFETRIDRAIREEQIQNLGSYKPRSGGIGKSLSKYPPEVLQEINVGIFRTMEKFGYKEMLIPNPSGWKLEPLDQYGVYIPPKDTKDLMINANGMKDIVRGRGRHTDWRVVRARMNGEKVKDLKKVCNCYKCLKARGDYNPSTATDNDTKTQKNT